MSFTSVFAEWHIVEVFADRLLHFGCFFVFADTPDYTLRLFDLRFPVSSLRIFAYYSRLSLGEGYSQLMDVVIQSEFAVLAVMSFLQAASER